MPLIEIKSDKPITKMPYPEKLAALRKHLSSDEFNAIVARINELIDAAGGEIATAGWLPGSDWTGTPFEPIYSKVANKNQSLSGMLFGLMVWYTVMQRPERWASGRYQLDGKDISSRTYFRIGA